MFKALVRTHADRVPLMRRKTYSLLLCLAMLGCNSPSTPSTSPSKHVEAETGAVQADARNMKSAHTSPVSFADVTAATGVEFTYSSGYEAEQYTILESLGGGLATFDFDRDGRLD